VKYKGKSIFDWGDISTCSFHATKIFHTGEGGAAFVNNVELYEKVFYSHNFGHNGPTDFQGVGINGKMSELQAAMGLAVLPYMGSILLRRKDNYIQYVKELKLLLQKIKIRESTEWNYSYVQIVLKSAEQVEILQEKYLVDGIMIRRYFYPSLNELNYVNFKSCPVAENLSKSIVTLPSFFDLSELVQNKVIQKLND